MSPKEEQDTPDEVKRKGYATDNFIDLAKKLIDEGLEPGLVLPCMLGAFWSFVANVGCYQMDFNNFNEAKTISEFFEKTTKEMITNHIMSEATLRGRAGNA